MTTASASASATQKLLSSLDPRRAHELGAELLAKGDIRIGGDRPWDVTVHDDRMWARVLRDGTLGVGESYMEGWWDTPALDQFADHALRVELQEVLRDNWMALPHVLRARVFNLQTLRRAFGNVHHHYDIGNELYRAMLGERMMYTCAYWPPGVSTLDEAQDAKCELVCRKIGLQPGMRVLDLGCGWGGFAAYAAEKHGAKVVGYTVAEEQVKWARERYAHLPVDIHLDDYRNAVGVFDRVVSIGLLEHVGYKNYRGYMELASRCLADGGVAFVHSIVGNRARADIDPWFDKYIFPNAVLPTLGRIVEAMDGLFITEDLHNLGEDYDRTLMAWWENFDRAWPTLRGRYGDAFYRMWKFYLLVSAGAFRARRQQLYQLVLTRPGTPCPPGRRG
ncbi:MAG TPA: cyclopropane fatty acyl phospholipid synthase [Kofleriaceae bacterium]|nr:cyclopropane fatty acyl phospholipid synthase [Kofleriaceae bacterium]